LWGFESLRPHHKDFNNLTATPDKIPQATAVVSHSEWALVEPVIRSLQSLRAQMSRSALGSGIVTVSAFELLPPEIRDWLIG
jgi:hypothetical protein